MSINRGDQPSVCQKCGSRWLYHDYDPAKRHNGYTCQNCGFEQVLVNGTKSLIQTARGEARYGR